MEKIMFTPEGEEEVAFFVVEQTRIGGIDYILVTDAEEGDGDAYILKDLSKPEDTEAVYEMVTEDDELDAVGSVFSSMLEDVELEK
ncbi:MAG: DUF1292 domain-containing protein [Lachnospiraceae bacterium]|nr:DUF1292 domain-containing protein [Lachnospiraceae bacterium]